MASFTYPNLDKHDPVRRLARRVQDLPAYFSVRPRVYLVGGAVRDICAGRPLRDIDVEVYGVGSETLRDLLEELFPTVVDVGVSYAICKIRDHQGREVDVALPRKEVKAGQGHKDFTIGVSPELSFVEATARRDFTINAMLLDPLTGDLIDPWSGLRDLRARVLRVVSREHFGEDPLRVWRAVQFVARYGLSVEQGTLKIMQGMVASGELATLSKERITAEWRKLLLAEKPALGVTLANELGIMFGGSPSSPELFDAAADFFAAHQVEDDAVIVVMLTLILRDLGLTDAEAASWLDNFTWGSDIGRAVLSTANIAHDIEAWDKRRRAGELIDAALVNAARVIAKSLSGLAPDAPALFLHIVSLHVSGKESGAAAAFADVMFQYDLLATADRPLLSAKEVMRETGLQPGSELGRALQSLEAARDAGDVLTKDDALVWLKTQIKRSA